jgi:hypothetical protein
MTEYVVDFGDEKSSAFVRLAMAQAESNGARLCEEIVRCIDCRLSIAGGFGCGKWSEFENVHPKGFCAWGERSDG